MHPPPKHGIQLTKEPELKHAIPPTKEHQLKPAIPQYLKSLNENMALTNYLDARDSVRQRQKKEKTERERERAREMHHVQFRLN